MRRAWLCVCLLLACEPSTGAGAACGRDSDCTIPLVCALGRCREACRSSRDCPAGTHCLVEPSTGLSACSIDQVDGCDATGCPDGFACRAHECVNLCGAIVRCPDGVCQDDVCMPPPDDAGVPPGDAGPVCHGPHCDPVTALALEGDRALVVTTSGEVWSWGDGAAVPARVLGPDGSPWTDAMAVAIGESSCVLRRDGSVWCWGANYAHQLGDGTTIARDLPVAVLDAANMAPLDGVVAIDTDGAVTCAIRGATRDPWCWGTNDDGALGDGTTTTPIAAVRATELGTGIAEIHTIGRRTITLDASGVLRGVGFDACASLGTTAGASVLHAVTLPMSGVSDFASTPFDTCAIGTDGTLRCWGLAGDITGHASGFSACAGCGSGSDPCTAMPQPILQPRDHAMVRLFGHSGGTYLGIDQGGALFAWGNAFDEPFVGSPDPVQLLGSGVAEARIRHAACVRTTSGDVLCFGQNDRGQLGRGTTSTSETDLASVVWP